jgi:hypothetical protein
MCKVERIICKRKRQNKKNTEENKVCKKANPKGEDKR